MGRHRHELGGRGAESDGVVSHGEVVHGRPRIRAGWVVAAAAAFPVAVFAWTLVGADDRATETAGFVVAEPETLGYGVGAAFDDTDELVVDEAGSPPVRAFGPTNSEDPWSEAFLLLRSDGTRHALLRGEVVDAGGVEAFLDATGVAMSVRWRQAGEVFTVRSARLNRDELIEVAAVVAATENGSTVPGYELLHEGPFRDFTTRPVLAYGGIPGAAGVVYDRLEEPASSVLITWAPGAEVLPWAPTVLSSSVSGMTIDGYEAAAVGPDPFGQLITLSWMQDGQLVQLAASEDFPEGLDGLVQVASRVEPIGEAEFTALLGEHGGGSAQFHLRRSLPAATSGLQVAQLRSQIDDGVFATVAIQRRRYGAYRLELDSDLGARRVALGLANLSLTTVIAVDVPVADTPDLSVLAGLVPPGTTGLTVSDPANRDSLAVVSRLETTNVPGTDQLLFVQAVAGSGGQDHFAVVVHHDGDRTEFRP